jgi:hypothetical protein
MIFLQKPEQTACYPSCCRWEAMIFLQKLTAHILPFLWQAGSHDSFAKTDSLQATLPVAGGGAMIFLQKIKTDRMPPFLWKAGSQDIFANTGSLHASLPVAGGKP